MHLNVQVCEEKERCDIVGKLRAELAAAKAENERLTEIICCIADEEQCWFDHHGGCQTHGYLNLAPGEKCPMGEANEIYLAKYGRKDGEG